MARGKKRKRKNRPRAPSKMHLRVREIEKAIELGSYDHAKLMYQAAYESCDGTSSQLEKLVQSYPVLIDEDSSHPEEE